MLMLHHLCDIILHDTRHINSYFKWKLSIAMGIFFSRELPLSLFAARYIILYVPQADKTMYKYEPEMTNFRILANAQTCALPRKKNRSK